MKICRLTKEKFEDFFNFNRLVYPKRKDIPERFEFQFLKNPLLKDKSQPHVLVGYDNNQMIGQMGAMPLRFYVDKNVFDGFCGCDLFVLEKYHGQGIGGFLKFKAMKQFQPYFTIGVSEDSKKLLGAIKAKKLGSVWQMIWFRNVFGLVKLAYHFLFKKKDLERKEIKGRRKGGVSSKDFPEVLTCQGEIFKKIDSLEQWDDYGWDQTLMFARSLNFLKWRFFSNDKYAFYMLRNTYFVVRKIHWFGMDLLAIVDYRVSLSDKGTFKVVLPAAKKLAKEIKCDGIITMSSHTFFDKLLKKNSFLKLGKEHEIFTNTSLTESSSQNIVERKFIYATMVDADLEYLFW